MAPREKPIGYWLKQLHDLIEAQLNTALDDLLITRRHWQVLNMLAAAPAAADRLDEALAPFRGEPGPGVEDVLTGPDGLLARGWVNRIGDDGAYALTETGRTAHGELSARVGAFRAKLMEGLTPQQYTETVRVLATMAANAEASVQPVSQT